jgi:hypothetical protein
MRPNCNGLSSNLEQFIFVLPSSKILFKDNLPEALGVNLGNEDRADSSAHLVTDLIIFLGDRKMILMDFHRHGHLQPLPY